jgi:hypothetical protein
LVLLSILLAAGGTYGYIAWAWEGLPPGSYPLWFFALPGLLAAGLLFALGTGILRCFGVGVFKDSEKP